MYRKPTSHYIHFSFMFEEFSVEKMESCKKWNIYLGI